MDDSIESALCFRDLDSANAIADVLHALTHLNSLVDVVFGNVCADIQLNFVLYLMNFAFFNIRSQQK